MQCTILCIHTVFGQRKHSLASLHASASAIKASNLCNMYLNFQGLFPNTEPKRFIIMFIYWSNIMQFCVVSCFSSTECPLLAFYIYTWNQMLWTVKLSTQFTFKLCFWCMMVRTVVSVETLKVPWFTNKLAVSRIWLCALSNRKSLCTHKYLST